MEQPQCATFIDVSSVKNSASHRGYLVLPFFSLTVNETSIFRPLPRSEATLLRYCRYSQRLKAASWEGPWSSRCRGRGHEGVTCTVTCECNSVLCRLLTADENKQPELVNWSAQPREIGLRKVFDADATIIKSRRACLHILPREQSNRNKLVISWTVNRLPGWADGPLNDVRHRSAALGYFHHQSWIKVPLFSTFLNELCTSCTKYTL